MTEEFERKDIDENNKENEEQGEEQYITKEERISKPVILSAEAYKTIILYASRYANQGIPPEQWKEIYGILTGYTDEDFVHVENAFALTFGHETDVQLDNRHLVFISEIEDNLYKEGKGHFVVGWFHSHPGLGLFFSEIDLINQIWFQQNNDDFCGLVFDHTLLGKKKEEKIGKNTLKKYDTGFEIYRITDLSVDTNSAEFGENYHKVDYIVEGLNKYFFANVLAELSSLVSAGTRGSRCRRTVSTLNSSTGNIHISSTPSIPSEGMIFSISSLVSKPVILTLWYPSSGTITSFLSIANNSLSTSSSA